MTEPRKATDVLLDLESKVDTLIGLVRSQDLVIKILSNKLNEVMSKMTAPQVARPTAEAPAMSPTPRMPFSPLQNLPQLDPERQVLVDAEVKLPATDSPQGFRRTSRPETFQGDDVYLGQKKEQQTIPKYPTQLPKPPPGRSTTPEVDFPEAPQPSQSVPAKQAKPVGKPVQQLVQNAIPVVQRIVDKSGKSIFLADVEITDLATAQSVFKTRTNGTGKWMASLGVGAYRVSIRKRGSDSKDKVEADQDIQVDGNKSPLELQTVIIR